MNNEQIGDMIRDAFYEAARLMQTCNGTLGPMSEDEIFAHWMESESRKQMMGALFPSTAGHRRPMGEPALLTDMEMGDNVQSV